MRILTFSSLYPSVVQPRHGIFVEQRLRHLVATGEIEAQVLAPVPWFPASHPRFGQYALYAKVPRHEHRDGIDVMHPRFPAIPKVGMSLLPALMAWAMRPVMRRLIRSGHDFGLIDAHYFYPDGVAAAMLGRWLGKPVVITARGTDINLIPNYSIPRAMILWAAQEAAAVITVSKALKDKLVALGVAERHITVLRNGVDLCLFHPVDRAAARQRLGVSGTVLFSVGNLVEGKGHRSAIRALAELPGVQLMIAGEGPLERELRRIATAADVISRVQFMGTVPQAELKYCYSAADAVVLASAREGMPNVILESLACGTRVVATRTGGIPEVVTGPEAGVLLDERTPQALARAVRKLLAEEGCPAATRRYGARFSWDETTCGQLELFARVLRNLKFRVLVPHCR